VASICMLFGDIFDPTITLGEAIGLALGIPALSFGIWKGISYLVYRWHPFKMCYQQSVRYENTLVTFDSMTIPIGKSNLVLRIRVKRPQQFDEVHIRLVNENKWFKVLYPKRHEVYVLKLKAEGLLGSSKMMTKKDSTNGMHGKYEPNFHRAPEESLILTATILATKEWGGYLVFRAKHAYGQSRCVYLPLYIKGKGESI